MYEIKRSNGLFTVYWDGKKIGTDSSERGARLIRSAHKRTNDPLYMGGRWTSSR